MAIVKDTNVLVKDIYPIIKAALDKNSKKFLANIHTFINTKHEQLFAPAPYDNIYFNATDLEKMYNSLGIKERDILPLCQNIVYWNWSGYNPGCAKEPYVLVLLCCIRYYLKNSERKNAEITTIYLAFTGKLYASLYGMVWKYKPSREVMDFVINNMLSDKFDLKREGSIFGAVKKLSITWLDTYESDIKSDSASDDDWGKLLQQLRDRVKSFIKNIGKLYYEAYQNKNYLNYETDSIDPDNFHLSDNDAATAARYTEATMNLLTSQTVSLKICKICVNDRIKDPQKIKLIIERILGDKNNLPDVRKVINVLICDYMSNNPKGRVGSVDFVSKSTKSKPNTKSKDLLQMKETVIKWLLNYYEKYGTLNQTSQYGIYNAIIAYFCWSIASAVNK